MNQFLSEPPLYFPVEYLSPEGEGNEEAEAIPLEDKEEEKIFYEVDDIQGANQTINRPEEEIRQLRNRNLIKRPTRYEVNIAECAEPSSFQEAIPSPDASNWSKAIEEELKAHETNDTWIIMEANDQPELIDSKLVFKIKRDSLGKDVRYKARLCARDFLQQPGRDHLETFSPVVRYDFIRVFLMIVAYENLEMVQFKTAFLYGKLDENVCMKIPEGLIAQNEWRPIVCKLVKALYGLKQASRCWNREFKTFLTRLNFKESDADKCIFIGEIDREKVYLILYRRRRFNSSEGTSCN